MYKYDSTTYYPDSIYKTILLEPPSNFKMTFKMVLGRNNANNWIKSGRDANVLEVGGFSGGNSTHNGIQRLNNVWSHYENSVSLSANVEYTIEYTYNNGVHTYSANGGTATLNEVFSHHDLSVWVEYGSIKEIMIEEL